MFYKTDNARANFQALGLPHDPFKSIVAPRPIGWISTVSSDGVHNLAPYSFFQAIATDPYLVLFSSEGWKDSATNARDSGEFVCSHVGFHQRDDMNASSVPAPPGVSEPDHALIAMTASQLVAPYRVAGSHAALECRVTEIIEPVGLENRPSGNVMVVGEVVGIYINDEVLTDGMFDVSLAQPITRMGYLDYDGPQGHFQMVRPDWP